eukprot:10857716-Alexandrium_andersonii.AAC.1
MPGSLARPERDNIEGTTVPESALSALEARFTRSCSTHSERFVSELSALWASSCAPFPGGYCQRSFAR